MSMKVEFYNKSHYRQACMSSNMSSSEEIYKNETRNAIGFAVHFPNKNTAKKLFEDPKD